MTGIYDEAADPEHAAIEWHDSEILAVADQSGALVLDLRAIVHRSRGEPGVDAGTVWVQSAAVVLSDGRWDGPRLTPPCPIADGRVETDSRSYDGMVPCPFLSNGRGLLELTLTTGERLVFEADSFSVTFTGEPEFLEDFVPDSFEAPGDA